MSNNLHGKGMRRPHDHGRRWHENGGNDAGNHYSQRNMTESQRRRQAALSLHRFATKRGHDRAYQEYQKRKSDKFRKNAELLREYQKAMRQEGYEVGKGASRKRAREPDSKQEDHDDDDDDAALSEKGRRAQREEADGGEERDISNQRRKKHKSDPLAKAKRQAQERKLQLQQSREQSALQRQQRIQTESKKAKDRKARAKAMMQRTKKGQPLMKHVIGDLLGKIQGSVGEDGS